MMCDNCEIDEATVHTEGSAVPERHLCMSCAKLLGVIVTKAPVAEGGDAVRFVRMDKRLWLELFFRLWKAIVKSDAASRVDRAEEEVGRVLKAEVRLDGTFAIRAKDGELVGAISREGLVGCRLALAQSLLGKNKDERPDCRGEARHVVLPIAAALGIEQIVRKDAADVLDAKNEPIPEDNTPLDS